MDENKTKKTSLVLKFKKRRYDGGNEIELIQQIERQKAAQFADMKKKQAEKCWQFHTMPICQMAECSL